MHPSSSAFSCPRHHSQKVFYCCLCQIVTDSFQDLRQNSPPVFQSRDRQTFFTAIPTAVEVEKLLLAEYTFLLHCSSLSFFSGSLCRPSSPTIPSTPSSFAFFLEMHQNSRKVPPVIRIPLIVPLVSFTSYVYPFPRNCRSVAASPGNSGSSSSPESPFMFITIHPVQSGGRSLIHSRYSCFKTVHRFNQGNRCFPHREDIRQLLTRIQSSRMIWYRSIGSGNLWPTFSSRSFARLPLPVKTHQPHDTARYLSSHGQSAPSRPWTHSRSNIRVPSRSVTGKYAFTNWNLFPINS